MSLQEIHDTINFLYMQATSASTRPCRRALSGQRTPPSGTENILWLTVPGPLEGSLGYFSRPAGRRGCLGCVAEFLDSPGTPVCITLPNNPPELLGFFVILLHLCVTIPLPLQSSLGDKVSRTWGLFSGSISSLILLVPTQILQSLFSFAEFFLMRQPGSSSILLSLSL